MKFLLFAAFALSLILVVSAQQCDTNAVLTCTQDYTRMITGVTDTAELQRIQRNFCRSTCVTTTIPACSSLSSTVQQAVDTIMRVCSALNGGPPSAGYSVFALLSSVILVGVAAVFF